NRSPTIHCTRKSHPRDFPTGHRHPCYSRPAQCGSRRSRTAESNSCCFRPSQHLTCSPGKYKHVKCSLDDRDLCCPGAHLTKDYCCWYPSMSISGANCRSIRFPRPYTTSAAIATGGISAEICMAVCFGEIRRRFSCSNTPKRFIDAQGVDH